MTGQELAASPPLFNLFLPESFIELPVGELDETGFRELAAQIATMYGLAPDTEIDQGLAEATALLASTAAAAEAGGSSFVAASVFRSPEVAERPMMVLVNCFCVESAHEDIDDAIAGLTEIHRKAATGAVEAVELPAGQAVIAESSTISEITEGANSFELTEQSITAWIPTHGVVLGIAVTSNNSEDWVHIVDLAQGIFEAFEWQEEPD